MSTAIISKEAILDKCQEFVLKNGFSALSIKEAAKLCNVAPSSLYYYFRSKEDLVVGIIESLWKDIFHKGARDVAEVSFELYIKNLFELIIDGMDKYPDFFKVYSLGFSGEKKRKTCSAMGKLFFRMREDVIYALKLDPLIKRDAFSQDFTEEDFADFILFNIMALVIQKKVDCEVLLEIIKLSIYKD